MMNEDVHGDGTRNEWKMMRYDQMHVALKKNDPAITVTIF